MVAGAETTSGWSELADLLLQRAGLVLRVARGRPPDPLAGLKLDDSDVAALLGELPGLEDASRRAEEVEEATSGAVTLAIERFEKFLRGDSAFASLAQYAGLTTEEAAVLSILCAVEAEPRRQKLVGYLNDDVTVRRPSLWTLSLLLPGDLRGDRSGDLPGGDAVGRMGPLAALAPGGALRRACLVEVPEDALWASAPVGVAPSVLWWLHGTPSRDPGLPPGVRWVHAPGGAAGESLPGGGLRDSGVGDRFEDGGAVGVVGVATGPDRRRRLQALARDLGDGRYLVLEECPPDRATWDAVVRQATLDAAGIVLEVDDDLPVTARDRIEATPHIRWGVSSRRELPVRSLPPRWRAVPVESPAATDDEWAEAFGTGAERILPLSAEQVELAGSALAALGISAADPAQVSADHVSEAVRRLAAGHIEASANRLRPSRTWEDLVLDPDREQLVRTVAMRCRQRRRVYEDWGFSPFPSRGVVALFAGPSGTGKTLAAEVIAGDVGVDLYVVDLANLVSKYIGETEKNLGQLFDAAEASNVALFFDEADALLGRRSAVSDAHDRYANIEVAYLLQRLERYDGLVVMATNLVNNLDPAFVRRLHVVVEFAVPGPQERRRIWARGLPPGAPVDPDVDLDALADHFEMTGGTIRNAVLTSAFLAAEAGGPLTMALVLQAVQIELRKIGRLVSDIDMRAIAGRSPGGGVR